ncbi:MAG: putative exopolysaccharide biosynthesis protein [Spirosoma sp.]|nr:putative exopolysaccharide biosynthesis protein [Spirosoma sp.]
MLNQPPHHSEVSSRELPSRQGSGGWLKILLFLRRSWGIIALAVVLAGLLGVAYSVLARPTYSATTSLLLDVRGSGNLQGQAAGGDSVSDSAAIESQVEVLRSSNIARRAVELLGAGYLDLENDEQPGLFGALLGWMIERPRQADAPTVRPQNTVSARAMERLSQQVRVRRVGLSYIVELSARGNTPERAARTANVITQAYMEEALAARRETTERARAWLQAQVEDLRARVQEADRAVQDQRRQANDVASTSRLRDLEAARSTYQSMYEAVLRRYAEALQQQTSPVTDARVISVAEPPLRKSSPQASILIPGTVLLGGIIGLVAAFLRERSDRSIRTADAAEALLQVRCLAMVPDVTLLNRGRSSQSPERMLWLAAHEPDSAFAAAVQRVAAAVEVRAAANRGLVLGLLSARAGEGKTTIGANLAAILGSMGVRTALLDLNFRTLGAGTMLAPALSSNASSAIEDEAAWVRAKHGVFANVEVIACAETRIAGGTGTPNAAALRRLVAQVKTEFTVVLLDFDPSLVAPEMAALEAQLDGVLVVIEWGVTPQYAVRGAIEANGLDERLIMGSVLNKVDQRLAARFQV